MTTVGDLMSTSPLTAQRSDVVGETRDALLESGVHSIPVIDAKGVPVGIVTSWDLVEEFAPLESIENVMTPRVKMIGSHQDVGEAAAMMRSNAIHHLVVVDEAQHIVGMISSLDLLELLCDDGEVLTPWM